MDVQRLLHASRLDIVADAHTAVDHVANAHTTGNCIADAQVVELKQQMITQQTFMQQMLTL